MSEQELELKMKQILDDYAPLLNAKTVDAEAIESPTASESSEPTDVESSSYPQKKKNRRLPDQKKQKV